MGRPLPPLLRGGAPQARPIARGHELGPQPAQEYPPQKAGGGPAPGGAKPADGVRGAAEERSAAGAPQAPDGPRATTPAPPAGEAERESAHAGRRGLGAAEERSAAGAAREHRTGPAPLRPPPQPGRPSDRASAPTAGCWW